MVFDYARMQGIATKLLTDFGKPQHIQIKRTTGGTFDPVLGETTGATVNTIDLVGVVTRVPDKLVDDTRVLKTDRMVVIDFANTPRMDDELVIGGKQAQIVDIIEVSPAGTPLIYKVITRG